jgi:UDP-N-acetyl-2-amino-2-deoxyglucuronate dehydrogenase
MKNNLGFGIIGTGSIAKLHAACVEKISDATLLGVWSKTKSRAQAVADDFNCPVYWEIDQLLKHPEIQVVIVCNESGLHGQTIAQLARAGKHILCEKPLETSLEKIDKIAQDLKSHPVKLACVFQNRENPEYQKLKNFVTEGVLGKLLLCQTSINWYRPESYYRDSWRGTLALDGGAAFINQGIHTLDLMLNLMGAVKEISGYIDTLHHEIEGEDVGVASLKFESGALGTISGGTALFPGEPESIQIYGTLGSVWFSGGKIVASTLTTIQQEMATQDYEAGTGASDPTAITDRFHLAVIEDFIYAIRNDKKPKVDLLEAKKSVELINALYSSKGTPQTP